MMDNDRKRDELLSEHELLRILLARIEEAAEQSRRNEPMGAVRLRTSLPTLRAVFEGHVQHEEALLSPLLENLDSWGPIRVERMRVEHAQQRRALSAVAYALERGKEDYLLAEQALQLARALREDMDVEEHDLFEEARLRDDAAAANQSGA